MPFVRSALMDSLAPPAADASRRLRRAVARRTARRLGRLGRRLGSIPPARRLRRLTREVEGLLDDLPAESRRTLLHGPDLRGFLSEAETWSGIAALARVAARRPRPRTTTPWNRLFESISRTDQLAVLVPGGRVDAALPRRALRLARKRLAALEGDLGALLLGARLAFGSARENGAGPVRLRLMADPEQGRPSHRIDLGTFIGAAGSLGLEVGRGRGIQAPRVLTATLRRGTLRLDGPRGGAVFPAAASPLRFSAGAEAGPARLVRRRLVPGTAILLAPALRSSPRRLVVGADLSGLDTRLAVALRLIRLSWPAAHREVLARTAMVVPVRESGLVSYSLAARPGVSFINVSGKSAVALADDLLHETAHHLLHDLQEVTRLLRRGPDTEETQAFESPWRGARRPLHGILHGAYTFLFRAELFARLLDARRRMPRVLGTLLGAGEAAFLARELRRELTLCSRAQRDLAVAARAGLLTPDGRALVRALAAWRRRIASRTS